MLMTLPVVTVEEHHTAVHITEVLKVQMNESEDDKIVNKKDKKVKVTTNSFKWPLGPSVVNKYLILFNLRKKGEKKLVYIYQKVR